jgi:hypothetical protein
MKLETLSHRKGKDFLFSVFVSLTRKNRNNWWWKDELRQQKTSIY